MPLGDLQAWHPHDRDAALALQMLHADECGQCGTRADEWDPDAGGSRAAYEARWWFCPGCAALDAAQGWPAMASGRRVGPDRDEDGNPMPGWHLGLSKRTR